jgi:hypothetical protein
LTIGTPLSKEAGFLVSYDRKGSMEGQSKLSSFTVATICCMLILACGGWRYAPSASPSVGSGWTDHLTDQNARWDWDYSAGTGYQSCPINVDGLGGTVCEIGITDQTTAAVYSDGNLHEDSIKHDGDDYAIFRVKCDVLGKGTKGWGFWNANMGAVSSVWFWWASEETVAAYRGFRAIVAIDGVPVYNIAISGIDITQWHTYRVARDIKKAYFFVDEVQVGYYFGTMPTETMRIETWIDNRAIEKKGLHVNLEVTQYQRIYIDYITFDHLPYSPASVSSSTSPGSSARCTYY